MTQAPEPLTNYRESVPAALERLVLKCLEKKAADRWQSAEELLPQLEALATPSGGVTPTQARPLTAHRRRPRFAWTISAVVVIVLAVMSVLLVRSRAPPAGSHWSGPSIRD